MSGTPWRSDSLPIVMGEYSDPEGRLLVDYQYTLKQAVEDKVCRSPKVVLVDNEHLSVTNDNKIESFTSILEMIKQTQNSYQSIIHNQEAMEYLLELGCKKLAEIRIQSPNAGGLVVAASVQHAQTIQSILTQKYTQTVSIVTYRHQEPLAKIEHYRQSDTQWIVSVGMISEGTDIPRLQVCCHMSAIKTELYFRQVLGRILRVNNAINQQAWLFTFAEESLIAFSERIEQDIPESCMFAKMTTPMVYEVENLLSTPNEIDLYENHETLGFHLNWSDIPSGNGNLQGSIDTFDDIRLGSFKQRIISAFTGLRS